MLTPPSVPCTPVLFSAGLGASGVPLQSSVILSAWPFLLLGCVLGTLIALVVSWDPHSSPLLGESMELSLGALS